MAALVVVLYHLSLIAQPFADDGTARLVWQTATETPLKLGFAGASHFEYIEIFHNRQRRHSALGYRTPIEYETLVINNIPAAS